MVIQGLSSIFLGNRLLNFVPNYLYYQQKNQRVGFTDCLQRRNGNMHAGQDLITAAGTPVLAMLPGRVVLVDDIDGYGLTVLLDHGRGWQTLYAHLLEAAVLPGAQLAAGERLGSVGQSGRASTAHLHVELRRRTPGGMVALDPTPLLADAVAALPPPQALQAQGLRPASP